MLENLINNIQKLKTELISGKFQEEILQQMLPEINSRLRQCVKESVGEFYDAYSSRKYYHPTRSLENIGEVVLKGKGQFFIVYNSNVLGGHHQSEDIIFNNVFKYGFHGGSQGIGHPGVLWRTPYGIYSRWGRPAPQSESPFNLIENAFDIIWETELKVKGDVLIEQKLNDSLYK